MRLLVTGSRDWDHLDSVDAVLRHYAFEAFSAGGQLVVVHGKAARGLDALAANWVRQKRLNGWPVDQDPYPADWNAPCVPECRPGHRQQRDNGSDYCPYAGFRRNQQMVDTRPLACIAFHRNGSSGTRDCLKRAVQARIARLRINWGERDQVDAPWLVEHAPHLAVR